MNRLSRFADPVYSIMRFVVGVLFACHGAQKIFGVLGGKVAAAPLMQFGGWVELAGGILVAVGLFTRPAAFLASGMMAVAYFMAHASGGFWPIVNKGELSVIYCFIFLFIFFYGPGRYALDTLIFRNRAGTDDTIPLGSRG